MKTVLIVMDGRSLKRAQFSVLRVSVARLRGFRLSDARPMPQVGPNYPIMFKQLRDLWRPGEE
jgi:hypothetical protein